jgi:hypothetical protein
MRKTIIFLVIMALLCSTAYAIYQAPTIEARSRNIVVKTLPMTGELTVMNGRQQTSERGVVLPDFKPTSTTEQKGLIIWNGKPGNTAIGGGGDPHTSAQTSIIDPIFKPNAGTQTKEIIDPLFIVDPTFRPQGSAQIIDPTWKSQTKSQSVTGKFGDLVINVNMGKNKQKTGYVGRDGKGGKQTYQPRFNPMGRTVDEAITGEISAPRMPSLSAQYAKQSKLATQARAQLSSQPRPTRITGNMTTEMVLRTVEIDQSPKGANPYTIGGAGKMATAGQAYSMGQKPITETANPYTLGGAGVTTTAGQAQNIDEILQERQLRAQQMLARGY